jgi:hypothetical protein
VGFGVMLGGFGVMMFGLKSVAVGSVRVMRGLHVIASFVMFCGFMMMLRRVFVVFRSLLVMFVCHIGSYLSLKYRVGYHTGNQIEYGLATLQPDEAANSFRQAIKA